VQGANVVISEAVEDQLQLFLGRGHGTDIAVAAAMGHLVSDRGDVTGPPAGFSPIRLPPTALGASLVW
jgi:hypothetical protein